MAGRDLKITRDGYTVMRCCVLDNVKDIHSLTTRWEKSGWSCTKTMRVANSKPPAVYVYFKKKATK